MNKEYTWLIYSDMTATNYLLSLNLDLKTDAFKSTKQEY